MDEMTKALQAEDERQAKLHELLETIREQIRLEVLPEHRPEGLFENIQNAVYAMRGRTPLMNDAVITSRLAAQPAAPVGEFKPKLMTCGGLANEARQCFCGSECEIARQNERDELTFLRAAIAAQPAAPVGMPDAWQYRCKKPDADKWSNWRPCEDPHDVEDIARHGKLAGYDAEARPLYAAPPPSTQKVMELLKRAQRTIERDYPNGQLAIDIRAALSTNPGEQE